MHNFTFFQYSEKNMSDEIQPEIKKKFPVFKILVWLYEQIVKVVILFMNKIVPFNDNVQVKMLFSYFTLKPWFRIIRVPELPKQTVFFAVKQFRSTDLTRSDLNNRSDEKRR